MFNLFIRDLEVIVNAARLKWLYVFYILSI